MNNRRSIRIEKRPFCSCYAAMATTLKLRWRGGCSNGRTLSVCIDLTHTGTVRHALLPPHHTHTIFPPPTHPSIQSVSRHTVSCYCLRLMLASSTPETICRHKSQDRRQLCKHVLYKFVLYICTHHDKIIRCCCLYMTQF